MRRVVRYLETEPSLAEVEERAAALKVHNPKIGLTAQIENQDEAKLLEAIVKWTKWVNR